MAKNGTTPPIPATDKDWEEFLEEAHNVIRMFGILLFVPVIVILAVGYALKAAVKVFLEKSLEMFNHWGEKPRGM
jgi:hypothetical protein